jgi:hypothetical protein
VEEVILSVPSGFSCSSFLFSPNSEQLLVQFQVLVRVLAEWHCHLPARIPLWRFVQVERRHNLRAPGIAGRSRSPPRAASQASWYHRSTPGPLWKAQS